MDWNQLMGFYYVAKLGSFTKAAEAIFKTQSALTHQIKALEADFDCLLFERIGKRKIRLTPAGVKLFSFAETTIEKYNHLLDDLNELKGLEKGQLKIAAPFTTLYHLLPLPIENYTKQFPWVELTILDRSQQNVIQLLKEGDIDFGFVLESMVPKELVSRRWKRVETVLLMSKNHPLAKEKEIRIEQLTPYPLILPHRETELQRRKKLDELFAKHGVDCRVVMESSNIELSSVYCEMGLGISFATIVKDLPGLKKRNLRFVQLSHDFEHDYLTLVMRKDLVLPSFKKAFIDLLLDIEES